MVSTLILACDRLDTLSKVVESVRKLDLGPIYVSCDAPRPGKSFEHLEVLGYLNAQLSLGTISYLNVREKNEGISEAIEGGIDWFFSEVDFGLILEDDVVLRENSSLVLTTGEKLMRGDGSIKAINLRNTVPNRILTQPSQGFRKSTLVSSHGWATTSDNWGDFRRSEKELSARDLSNQIPFFLGRLSILAFLESAIKNESLRQTREYNWDFAWQVFIFKNQFYTLNSNQNLVNYVGYRSDSTHDRKNQRQKEILHETPDPDMLNFDAQPILEPQADRYRFTTDMRHTFPRFVVRKLRVNRFVPNILNW